MTPSTFDVCMVTLTGVDQIAHEMELKWGIGRLPLLVSDTTRASWLRGLAAWSDAIRDWEPTTLATVGAKMRAAWTFMDREATTLGKFPLAPDAMETLLPDGRLVVIVRTVEDAHALVKRLAPDGRAALVMHAGEVARLIANATDLHTAILLQWPGAETRSARVTTPGLARDWVMGDGLTEMLHGDEATTLQVGGATGI